MQVHWIISKHCRIIKDWRCMYKDLKDIVDMGKTKQEELGGEVAALRAELAQVQD